MVRKQDQPLILLYGCKELGKPLQELGMRTSRVRNLGQIIQPKEDLHARSIIMGTDVLDEISTTRTIPRLRNDWPMVDLMIWSTEISALMVRELLKDGARDVILDPSPAHCARQVVKIVHDQKLLPRATRLADEKSDRSQFEGMYSRSRTMWDLFDTATQVAPTDATVLILGETGTGKELLARALHKRSGRHGRFVPINCGGVNEALIDSELFGHVKGAFTGASGSKEGLFKHADGGTLFLDEIGNVPLNAQYRLLRALQENTIRPVGGHEEISVNVRVIAATSSSLEEDVKRGSFREDLFYRLDVIRLELPPLRKRPKDIVFLFAQFARQLAETYNVDRPDLREDFLDVLVHYDWPGNVRQLENFTERLVLTCTGKTIGAEKFKSLLPFQPESVPAVRDGAEDEYPGLPQIDLDKSLQEVIQPLLSQMEARYLIHCLKKTQGRVGEASEIAGINRRTMLRKLKLYSIDRTEFQDSTQEHQDDTL